MHAYYLRLPLLSPLDALRQLRRGKELIAQNQETLKCTVINQDTKIEFTQRRFQELGDKYYFYLNCPEEYQKFCREFETGIMLNLVGSLVFMLFAMVFGINYGLSLPTRFNLNESQLLFLALSLSYLSVYFLVTITELMDKQDKEFRRRFLP